MPAHTTSNNAPEVNQARAASVHHCTASWIGADRELACSRIPTNAPIPPFSRRQKPPTFSRKTRGLCLLTVPLKERFDTARPRFFKSRPPGYKGCRGAVCVKTFPWRSHGFVRQPVKLPPDRACVFFGESHRKKVRTVSAWVKRLERPDSKGYSRYGAGNI